MASSGFTINSPASLLQCEPLLLSWSGGQAPYYLTVTQGGHIGTVLENLGKQTGTSYTWTVDQPIGASVTFYITDSTGLATASAPSPPIKSGTTDCKIASGASAATSGGDDSTSSGSHSSGGGGGGPSSGNQGTSSGGPSAPKASSGSGGVSGNGSTTTSTSTSPPASSTDASTPMPDPEPVVPVVPASGGVGAPASTNKTSHAARSLRPGNASTSALLTAGFLVAVSAFVAFAP